MSGILMQFQDGRCIDQDSQVADCACILYAFGVSGIVHDHLLGESNKCNSQLPFYRATRAPMFIICCVWLMQPCIRSAA